MNIQGPVSALFSGKYMPGMLASYLLEKEMPTTGPMLITLMRLSGIECKRLKVLPDLGCWGTKQTLFSDLMVIFFSGGCGAGRRNTAKPCLMVPNRVWA